MAVNPVEVHGVLEEARKVATALNISMEEAILGIQCLKTQEMLQGVANMVTVTVRGTWPPGDWPAAKKAGFLPTPSQANGNGNGGAAEDPLDSIIQDLTDQDEASNADEWIVFPVLVENAGTPVQGPNIPVDFGTEVIVRQRRHGTARTGYVAPTAAGTANVFGRSEFGNNDSFTKRVANLSMFWFDASASTTYFELIMERVKIK